MTRLVSALAALFALAASAPGLEPVSDKLVVLTFDDASRSHSAVARPVLLKYKFGATFFVTEGWDFATNQKDYMTWKEIKQLHEDGFEKGGRDRVSALRARTALLGQSVAAEPGTSRLAADSVIPVEPCVKTV